MRQNHIIATALLIISLMVATGIWWLCERSDSIAFLPAAAGAEWIVYPQTSQIKPHPAFPVDGIFNRAFKLDSQPVHADLSIRAFKNASVKINNHEVEGLNLAGQNWKLPATVDIARVLQPGT
ncbi:MAG TPA: hypothetical protein VN516_02670, partial [Candidatus Baltobacteraceae bacterium]|nr:hypothetical protein [Candidatus Baltobacteraceae bacterium]